VQGGGFTLHITPRFAGYAWHLYLYLSQGSSGGLHVEGWTTEDEKYPVHAEPDEK
jgi:hypothetical protein